MCSGSVIGMGLGFALVASFREKTGFPGVSWNRRLGTQPQVAFLLFCLLLFHSSFSSPLLGLFRLSPRSRRAQDVDQGASPSQENSLAVQSNAEKPQGPQLLPSSLSSSPGGNFRALSQSEERTKRRIVLLGSTGSIGRSTLEVVKEYPERFEVVGLAANGSQLPLLVEQILHHA